MIPKTLRICAACGKLQPRRDKVDFISEASKLLKVVEVKGVSPMSTLVYSKGVIDRTWSGMRMDKIALHIVYEAARQKDVPITTLDFNKLTRRKLDLTLLSKVQKVFRVLGYKPRIIGILTLARDVAKAEWFPKEPVGISDKFVKVAEDYVKTKCIARTAPKSMMAAFLVLAGNLLGVEIKMKKAVILTYRTKISWRSFVRHASRFMKIAKQVLKESGYEWKTIQNPQ